MSYSMWIELHQEFRGHPKVGWLAQSLGCSKLEATGITVNLWLWASQYCPSGSLEGYSGSDLADACLYDGDADLLEGLKKSKLVDANNCIHDWKKHGLRFIEAKRRRDNNYKRRKKLEGQTATPRRRQKGVLPNLTIPNLTIPEELQKVDGFIKAWEEWTAFRSEIRKPLKAMTADRQLRKLATMADPVGVINQSITNGWQGLFELRRNNAGTKSGGKGNSQIERATFTHDESAIKRLKEIEESMRERDRERGERP